MERIESTFSRHICFSCGEHLEKYDAYHASGFIECWGRKMAIETAFHDKCLIAFVGDLIPYVLGKGEEETPVGDWATRKLTLMELENLL